MVSEEQLIQALQKHDADISAIKEGFKAVPQLVEDKFKEKSGGLPTYFGRKEQIVEELEAQGYFTKDEAGLQDDFGNAFRMFTQTNQKGDMISGLVNEHGQPATLMELYQTMDLRGVVWNYGVGWLSAFKGGWNAAHGDARKKAKDYIDKLIEERDAVAKMNPKEIAEFLEAQNKMAYNNEVKDFDLNYQLQAKMKQMHDFYFPKKPKGKRYAIITHNKATGKVDFKYKTLPADIAGSKVFTIDKPEEIQAKSTEEAFREYRKRGVVV